MNPIAHRPSVRRLSAVAAALVLATVAACGTTTRFTPTNPAPRTMQPRAPHTVHVYTTGAPDLSYVEVGIIQSRQSSEFSFDDMPEIIAEMRKEAAAIGCDGVIINGVDNKVGGYSDRDGGSTYTLEGYWGACIMYTEPTTAAR